MGGDLERISYELALRALDKQEHLLEQLRSRTGVLLGASLLATTFSTQVVAQRPGTSLAALGAWSAFILSVVASVGVLASRRELVFSLSGLVTYRTLQVARDDIAEVHVRLVYELHHFWMDNAQTIDRLSARYRAAVVAVLVEMLSLAALASDSVFAG